MKNQSDEVLTNGKGKEIPIEMVRDDHLKKHKLVMKVFVAGVKLEQKIMKDKQRMLNRITAYQRWLEKHYGGTVEFKNLILSDYSNEHKIEIKSNRIIEFDEKIQLAETLLKKSIKSWSKDSNRNMVVIIDEIFKTDKKGFLDKNKILSLKQYKITDPDWQAAIKLIDDSINIVDRKSYMMIKYKVGNTWKCLNLNFSSAETE